MESELARAADLVRGAERITVLTGAGISTDSGIPDFRGPNGVWTRNPEAQRMFTLQNYITDADVRRRAWQSRRDHTAWTAEPNAAHRALVELEQAGKLVAVVTQNIDGLHQKAGSSPERVIEVHGTIWWVACLGCEVRTPTHEVLARLDDEPDPRCTVCGGILKSATISFGQALDNDVLDAAWVATRDCDVFLAVGTSLSVRPVSGLCEVAVEHGARFVIVNAEPTPYDGLADVVLRGPVGEILPALVAPIARSTA